MAKGNGTPRNARGASANGFMQRLKGCHGHTKRNTVMVFSGYKQKPSARPESLMITEDDVDSIIAVTHKLSNDTLDLVIHSPGGSLHAAEQVADYLARKFTSFRVIVPRNAMSAAGMISCSADEILMTLHPFLGPTDVQLPGPIPIHDKYYSSRLILEHMHNIMKHMDNRERLLYRTRHAAYMIQVNDFIKLGEELLAGWIADHMFAGSKGKKKDAARIARWLSSKRIHKVHARNLNSTALAKQGLKVTALGNHPALHDLVLELYFAAVQEVKSTTAGKIICAHTGTTILTEV